jgi:hypothetical protein
MAIRNVMYRNFVQRRRNEEYRIELDETHLTYHSRTRGNEGSATVPYELLSRKTTSFNRENTFFRNAAIYFGILVVVTAGFGFLVDIDPGVAILWGLLAGGCYATYRLTGVRYEVFPLADGRVFRLIAGKPTPDAYRTFRRELYERRDAYLRDRYARIDVERPATLERRRIEWLHDEQVIGHDAFITIVETIEDHAAP